jgi:hypothetical protein
MDQAVISQYAHRVGFLLSGDAFCDGCYHAFEDGEMGLRCLECSGFVCPGSNERTLRQVSLTTNLQHQSGPMEMNMPRTKSFSGYDLCLECAKHPSLHSHHRFTLTMCRK